MRLKLEFCFVRTFRDGKLDSACFSILLGCKINTKCTASLFFLSPSVGLNCTSHLREWRKGRAARSPHVVGGPQAQGECRRGGLCPEHRCRGPPLTNWLRTAQRAEVQGNHGDSVSACECVLLSFPRALSCNGRETAVHAAGNCFSLRMGLQAALCLLGICLSSQTCNSWASVALSWALLGASNVEGVSARV